MTTPAVEEVKTRIIVQSPGEVPFLKGPFPPAMVEGFLREFYEANPGAIAIVMPGLPDGIHPQHGEEFLDEVDAERCRCQVDKPRNPKCPVDHAQRERRRASR